MIVLNVNTNTSYVKATIPNFIGKDFYDNHRVTLRTSTGQQALSSANSEIVTVQYEKPLVAVIVKNSDV